MSSYWGLPPHIELKLSRCSNILVLCVCLLFVGCKSTQQNKPLISPDRILEDITWLASDEMKGRYFLSDEARKAANYISTKWKRAGWTPLKNRSSMYIPINVDRAAPNVVAMWEGSGSTYVVIIAHYDHLKQKRTGEDRIFNGADDNASGTAALIAIAEAVQQLNPSLEASLVLIASTGEEAGCLALNTLLKKRYCH